MPYISQKESTCLNGIVSLFLCHHRTWHWYEWLRHFTLVCSHVFFLKGPWLERTGPNSLVHASSFETDIKFSVKYCRLLGGDHLHLLPNSLGGDEKKTHWQWNCGAVMGGYRHQCMNLHQPKHLACSLLTLLHGLLQGQSWLAHTAAQISDFCNKLPWPLQFRHNRDSEDCHSCRILWTRK